MGASPTADEPDDVARGRGRALIVEHVRLRFALDVESFLTRALEVARAHAPAGVAPSAYLTRLSLDDLYLASACAAGDEAAWTECVATHRDFIHRFAHRVLAEPAASDLADGVIADLWQCRKIARYEGRSTLRTWLGTVVSHAAVNAAAASQVRQRREGEAPGARAADPESDLDGARRSSELARLLAESIAGQPAQDRLLVLLYYEQGLTLEAIGSVMGLSKAAVSRRLKRIREALLEAADTLARRRLGTSARSLVDGLQLSMVDLDLRAACRLAAERGPTEPV
jgi:RNA polymerase sigma-70 factor, ECF subfamily